MDRVTKSLLRDFVTDSGLHELDESRQFEHFASYTVTASHHFETFDSRDIVVGAGSDLGVDAIAVIVNGSLITEPEEIDDLCEINGYLDVTLVFVQATRSSGFSTEKIGQFGFGVANVLKEGSELPKNDDVQLKAEIISEIFARSSYFRKGNPLCYLYYVTTGRWTNDKNLVARKNYVIEDLKSLQLLRDVSFDCLGAEELQTLYRDSKNAISKEILFSQRIVLPDLPGVEQAFLGLLPAPEFLKLLENTNEEVIASVFYDNVRHWQGWNSVNAEIKKTLENERQRMRFPLLNNGVTIVAKRVNPTGNRFTLEDYQIVNGCQTSFVLHQTKSHLSEEILVPIRLIATTDTEVRNEIIKATNRQTEVTEEQFFALYDFPRQLEEYFSTFEGHKRLFYERRSQQYTGVDGIEKVRIIDIKTLVRAFASIFLELPHRTTRNYKALLKLVNRDVFSKEHRLEMYYTAAYASYRLEYLFRSQTLSSDLKPARYHLLMAYRMLCNPGELPPFNSNDMKRYCQTLMENLWDNDAYKEVFTDAANIIRSVASGNLHRDNVRTEPFTEKVKARFSANDKE